MRKRRINVFLSLFILFISTIFTLKIGITYEKYVDSYFIFSALLSSAFLFKLLLDKGAFNILGFSWYKTKQYILFFLPRYRLEDHKSDNIKEYLEYKEKKKWKSLSSLIFTSLFHLIIASILSLLIYYID